MLNRQILKLVILAILASGIIFIIADYKELKKQIVMKKGSLK